MNSQFHTDVTAFKTSLIDKTFLKKMYFRESELNLINIEYPIFLLNDENITFLYNLLKSNFELLYHHWLQGQNNYDIRFICQTFFKEICHDFFSQYPVKSLILNPTDKTLGNALSDILISYLQSPVSGNLSYLALSQPFSSTTILEIAELLTTNTSIKTLIIGDSLFKHEKADAEQCANTLVSIFQKNKNIKCLSCSYSSLLLQVLKESRYLSHLYINSIMATVNTKLYSDIFDIPRDKASEQFRETLSQVKIPLTITVKQVQSNVKGLEKLAETVKGNTNILGLVSEQRIDCLTHPINFSDDERKSQYDYDSDNIELQHAWSAIEEICNNHVEKQVDLFFDTYFVMLAELTLPKGDSSLALLNPDIFLHIISFFLELWHPKIQNHIFELAKMRSLITPCPSTLFSNKKEVEVMEVEEVSESNDMELIITTSVMPTFPSQ